MYMKKYFFSIIMLLSATILRAQTTNSQLSTDKQLSTLNCQLSTQLDSLIQNSPLLETTQLGLMVWDLTADSALYTYNHRHRMRPASTMKLLTAITLLDLYGGDYTFTTELRYKGEIVGRTLVGDLVCVGCMDPSFDNGDMNYLVDRIRVAGIDTSLRCTGLAAVDATGSRISFVDCRPIPNPARRPLPECLVHIADMLEAYLDEFRPDEIAMEGIFFCKNARTSLILGHARGVVVAACARRGLPMHEYPPARVKRAVTGTGAATKDQMRRMMQRVFGLPELPQEDSADALAIALTHLHERRLSALARGLRIPDPRALR